MMQVSDGLDWSHMQCQKSNLNVRSSGECASQSGLSPDTGPSARENSIMGMCEKLVTLKEEEEEAVTV